MAKVGIAGSGVAGMAAAIRLRSQGHEVEIFEANSFPGGKLHQFLQDGYRFDAGPSLFTMPHFLDEVFVRAGKDPRQYFNYERIDPGCHYFWEDGTSFSAQADLEKFIASASSTFGESEKNLRVYFQKAFALYDLTEDVFLKNSLHKAATYLKLSTLKSFAQLYNARIFENMHEVNRTAFENPKLTQVFDRYATYNGSDPYRAPGTLTVIPTLEYRWGTFLPEGGMNTISKALHQLAVDIGVKFHFGENVEAINVESGRVTGLQTSKGSYQFDSVVSNMDVVGTFAHLLKGQKAPKRILNQERSSSALIFYWGVKKQFPKLGLHNIFWSNDYRKEFKTLFEEKDITNDPTVYVNITSKHVVSDAPDGCENWFVMVNAPHVAGQDWKALAEKTRANILRKLSEMLGCDIDSLIETERILDPPGIASQTSSHLGSLYGTSSNSRMAAFLRQPNFHSSIKNLYFCGGSVHPGGGIPLCLLSGKIVSDLAG